MLNTDSESTNSLETTVLIICQIKLKNTSIHNFYLLKDYQKSNIQNKTYFHD